MERSIKLWFITNQIDTKKKKEVEGERGSKRKEGKTERGLLVNQPPPNLNKQLIFSKNQQKTVVVQVVA